jgi:hypothetical protein
MLFWQRTWLAGRFRRKGPADSRERSGRSPTTRTTHRCRMKSAAAPGDGVWRYAKVTVCENSAGHGRRAGKPRRSWTTAANSPPRSKAARIAAAASSEPVNIGPECPPATASESIAGAMVIPPRGLSRTVPVDPTRSQVQGSDTPSGQFMAMCGGCPDAPPLTRRRRRVSPGVCKKIFVDFARLPILRRFAERVESPYDPGK